MKSPLLYILEVLFCSGLLLAFYRLLLVRKVSFRACRRYLVAAVFLSAVIPALDIPLYPARTVVYPLPLIAAPPAENFVQTTGELPAAGPVVPAGWRAHIAPGGCGRLSDGGVSVAWVSCGPHGRNSPSAATVASDRLRGVHPCRASADRHSLFVPAHGFSGRGIRRAPAHDRSLP